jgi:WD40 repeat protein
MIVPVCGFSFKIYCGNLISTMLHSHLMNKILATTLFLSSVFSLSGQNSLETVIQKGHELGVLSVAISPDSNFVVTGSKDKAVKLWEYNTGREVRTFAGHENWVTSVDFSSDGRLAISGSYDKSVRIWNVESGKEMFALLSEDFITDVAFDPLLRFFVTAGYNRYGTPDSATVFDLKSKNKIARLPIKADEGRGYGVSVSVSPDGKYIGFGEDNRVVNVYTTSDWKKVNTFEFTEGWCGGCGTFLRFGRNNEVYVVSQRGPLKKYNLSQGNLLYVYEENIADVTDVSLSRDGTKLARATEKNIKVYDAASGNILATLEAESKDSFHRIVFSTDNKKLIIASENNTAFAWNFTTNKKEVVLTGFLNERDKGGLNYDSKWESSMARYVRFKNSLLITRDGKSLIKGKFGKKIKQWDIATGKAVMEFNGHSKAVLCYDLSKDGSKLITGGGDGKIILWDMKTGDSLKTINSYKEPIFDIRFSADETRAVSCSWDASMKIHDLKTGLRTTYIEFTDNYAAYNTIFHPGDIYILSAKLNNVVELWEPDTRTVVRTFTGHTDIVSAVSFSSDGKTLMTASWDGSIRLWDVGSGLMNKKLKGHRGAVYTAVFGSDGKYIYSGGADRTVRVWDSSTGNLLKTYEAHQAEVTSLLFSPDNKLLISHSVDGVTKFWDLASGKEFFEHIHIGDNDWMVKNPEGYFNGTDNARKYIHFVNGTRTFSVDQFFNDFYRPDLLPKIFQNRGGSDELKDIQGKLKTSPPPTIRIAVVSNGEGKAEVLMRLTDNGAGIDNVKLFHNGKNIPVNTQALTLPSGKGQTTTYKHPVTLIGGNNIFTASARNRDNVESDPQAAEIFSEVASKSSVCHVLAVGINKYKNPRMSLNYAKPDAESFGKLLDQRGTNLFKSLRLYTLYDEQATKEEILKMLDALAGQVNPEDVFIFYYAGHGSMVDNQFYFIPTESSRLYDAASLNKEAIEASLLQEKFKHIKALKQLIVMDACQSGGSVELLATRGANEEKAIAQLSRSAGIHVMASAGSEQFATEFNELGHGLFTYVFIRGLQGEADGAPKDGKVTIYELKSFIDDQVPEMTRKLKGKPQYPYTFSRGHDFPVAIE